MAFFAANIPKIPLGGWISLVIGAAVFVLLSTWRRGRELVQQRLQEEAMPVSEFLEHLQKNPPVRVDGIAVFLFSSRQVNPPRY